MKSQAHDARRTLRKRLTTPATASTATASTATASTATASTATTEVDVEGAPR